MNRDFHYKVTAYTALLVVCCAAWATPGRVLASQPDDHQAWVPPAAPLVACDPYFSIWSQGKNLTDVDTTHWTGKPHRLASLVRIDGKTYRLMGATPKSAPPLKQTSVEVTPTRSVYGFEGAGVRIELTFMTPSLPEDIDLLSRPITYVTYAYSSTDGDPHEVQTLLSGSAEIAVNTPDQHVDATCQTHESYVAAKIGSTNQVVLNRAGDDLRIDWGYFYLAAAKNQLASCALGSPSDLSQKFTAGKEAAPVASLSQSQPAGDLAAALVLKEVTVNEAPVSQWLVLAYDDLYSIEFMGSKLRPYWRRNGMDAEGLLRDALRDYSSLVARCEAFDQELTADLKQVGGAEYAQIAALAYRQCFAAGKFVADANGQPIQFCKENHSNGCIGTSDVFYPMAPQFLLFGPSLAKSFVVPFMEYAASDRWKFPFAPHDLGTYPKANGQVYGGGERSEENQMPVEESGNMLILMAAIAELDGDAEFAGKYWPQLVQWAEYLKQQGYDPDRQLCTDDFAGHLAHNVNLSAKAICGLGCFAKLCEMRGESELAKEYRATAEQFAKRWIEQSDDGDHFRLAFDKPGTWSQKYNLVWDRVLGLELFPEEVLQKEMAHYLRVQNRYGLPLDNRKAYTKLDWVLWTATLTQNRDDFTALVKPVHRFLHETPNRVPMTDWYETDSGRRVGFTARPVVGGVFMQMLHDQQAWKKWAERDTTNAGDYAGMPRPPKVEALLPAADIEAVSWRYRKRSPNEGWNEPGYDDSGWRIGKSGFGDPSTPGATVGTVWKGSEVWLRRDFSLQGKIDDSLHLHIHHDEDAEVYINGELAGRFRGYTTGYVNVPLRKETSASLKPSGNVLAIYCRQTTGGQYIDAGIVSVKPADD